MMTNLRNALRLLWHALVFWGVAWLLVLQTERLLLLPQVTTIEPSTVSVLAATFFAGLCNDFIVVTMGMILVLFLAGIATGLRRLYQPMRTIPEFCDTYRKAL